MLCLGGSRQSCSDTCPTTASSLAHLSLVWQCLQQKQELWKTNLSATSRSMGYTVFWQAVHISFTCAFRLKDWQRAEQRETENEEGVWDTLDPSTAL